MSIMESMNIGSNALKAHGLRLDIHAKNIANVVGNPPNTILFFDGADFVVVVIEDLQFTHVLLSFLDNLRDIYAKRVA